MAALSNSNSYAPDNIIVVGASSCLSHILIVTFYFWLILDVSGHHYSSGVAQNSDLLVTSIWSLMATTLVSTLAFLLKRFIRYIPPSWLAIPLGSTFLFIFSVAIYVYWVSVTSYSAETPFRTQPPPFGAVVMSAFGTSLVVSVLTTAIAFASYAYWVTRDNGTDLDIAP